MRLDLFKLTVRLVVVSLLLVCCACRNHDVHALCASSGICDPDPLPPIIVDVVCDASDGSSCSQASLRQSCDRVLPRLADRRPEAVVNSNRKTPRHVAPQVRNVPDKLKRCLHRRIAASGGSLILQGNRPF